MRVLLVPEVYRTEDVTACGTVNDSVTWIEHWLERDPRLHVYWLLPPRDQAGYEAVDVGADRERVTLLEATPLAATDRPLLTEDGYSPAELDAVEAGIYDPGAYVDVVVDQRRTGRATLYKWLLAHTDHWAAEVRPFDVVANVHDLQVPEKYRWCDHRNGYQMFHELSAVAFADGSWFTAGVDARRFRERASDIFRPAVVEETLARAVTIGSPIPFDDFETSFADQPGWLHVAGSAWEKKDQDLVLDVAADLHDRFGVQTVLTSPEAVPDRYCERPFVEAYPRATQATYQRALRRGDLAICASEYETMARTPFEQAASGQVLVLRAEPWIAECAPSEYCLAGDPDELAELARWAVTHWDEAVGATRRLLDHARETRGPEIVGRRTYDDLSGRVRRKRQAFEDAEAIDVVQDALDDVGRAVVMDDLLQATDSYTEAGYPLHETDEGSYTDVIYALRSLGYADRGNPGTPVFECVNGDAVLDDGP